MCWPSASCLRLDFTKPNDYIELLLAASVVCLFTFLTVLNHGNHPVVTPPSREMLAELGDVEEEADEEGDAPDSTQPPAESTQTDDVSYGEFQTAQAYPGIDGEVIELDDLITEVPSPPSPAEDRPRLSRTRSRSNSLRNLRSRRRSRSASRQRSEATTTGFAASQEALNPGESQPSILTLLRRRRPNDTESRGSEVYRLEPPYDSYYRRRAASVPALRTGLNDE